MTQQIVNQYGHYITCEKIRGEINYALEKGMTYTYFNETKIDIESNKKTETEHITLVSVDYEDMKCIN